MVVADVEHAGEAAGVARVDQPLQALRAAVGVVVVHDHRDRQLQTRHVPERRGAEEERAVADETDDLFAWPCELHAGRCSDARPEMRAVIEEQLAPAARVELEAVRNVYRAGLMDDDRVSIGPLCHVVCHAICLEWTRIPVRVA